MRSSLAGFFLVAFFLSPPRSAAQLVTDPSAIPRTGNPPVIFLNGHETDCSGTTFQRDFGIADLVLQSTGRASFFFNNCSYGGNLSIERLGAAFGGLLSNLKYAGGEPVDVVDVVAYSMGGLIVRSYLSGKQEAQGVFSPPPVTHIRKAVFIATPNFGTPVALLAFGLLDTQTDELSSGSHFLMDLNTWNQGHDDLRGIDAIAIAGNGGTGLAISPGFDDGLVALSSASLGFYLAGRTRILPLCHAASPSFVTYTGLCLPGASGLAKVISASGDNVRIISSFLNGTPEWQSIGSTLEQNSFLKTGGGLLVRARTAADVAVTPASIVASPANGPAKKLNMSNTEIGYTDLIAAGAVSLSVSSAASSFVRDVAVPAGGARALIVKPGPLIDAVIPAAGPVFPLVLAPRMIVSIYGRSLSAGPAPVDTTVSLNGVPVQLLYVSPAQINAVLPANVSGLNKLLVQNSTGSQTVNIWVESAFPAVFTLADGSAAALNATNNAVVSSANPLHGGEYMELFLTGLGATSSRNGLDYATLQPTVSVAGIDCPVTYAGAAPLYSGLDQINCRIPAGLGTQPAATIIVRSGGRSSPPVNVALQ